MWCKSCQQDVCGVPGSSGQQISCPRCGEHLNLREDPAHTQVSGHESVRVSESAMSSQPASESATQSEGSHGSASASSTQSGPAAAFPALDPETIPRSGEPTAVDPPIFRLDSKKSGSARFDLPSLRSGETDQRSPKFRLDPPAIASKCQANKAVIRFDVSHSAFGSSPHKRDESHTEHGPDGPTMNEPPHDFSASATDDARVPTSQRSALSSVLIAVGLTSGLCGLIITAWARSVPEKSDLLSVGVPFIVAGVIALFIAVSVRLLGPESLPNDSVANGEALAGQILNGLSDTSQPLSLTDTVATKPLPEPRKPASPDDPRSLLDDLHEQINMLSSSVGSAKE